MHSTRTVGVTVLGCAMIVAAALSVHHLRNAEGVEDSSPVAAVVNGTAITADEVDIRLEELLPSASYHGQVQPERLLSLRRAALDQLILDELIYQQARATGRRPSPAAVDAEWAEVAGRFESAGEFAAALEEQRLTERALRERLSRRVVVREARAARERQVVTDEDVGAYYLEHAAKFRRPEQVRLLQILLRAEPADPASWRRAERRARLVLAELERGADFGALAWKYSEDEYRVKGGDMGLVHRGRLDEQFEAAVFAADERRPTLARSLHGFQVFMVLERQPPIQLSLAEAWAAIAQRLERQRREEATARWYAMLLSSARVEIRDIALRAARPLEPDRAKGAGGNERGSGGRP